MLKHSEYDEEPVFYCTRCMSLAVKTDKKGIIYCSECGASPKHIDITNIHRWMRLYQERTGHHPLAQEPSKYDDLKEVYSEEAEEILTSSEALSNGMRVGEKINRKIDE